MLKNLPLIAMHAQYLEGGTYPLLHLALDLQGLGSCSLGSTKPLRRALRENAQEHGEGTCALPGTGSLRCVG